MAWSTPPIHATGDVVSASDWNILANDLTYLDTFLAGVTGATVATLETTTSTSYTNLATVGPSVTCTTGTTAIVLIGAAAGNSTAADSAIVSFAVSGSTTIAAADGNSAQAGGATTQTVSCVAPVYLTGLTAGSNTFTAKYRCGGAGTATFLRRWITVIPLP